VTDHISIAKQQQLLTESQLTFSATSTIEFSQLRNPRSFFIEDRLEYSSIRATTHSPQAIPASPVVSTSREGPQLNHASSRTDKGSAGSLVTGAQQVRVDGKVGSTLNSVVPSGSRVTVTLSGLGGR
jgi:hypothetical protein